MDNLEIKYHIYVTIMWIFFVNNKENIKNFTIINKDVTLVNN